MEKDEREKKLKAGKEKLAAFQKKKSKKKKSRAATGGESLAGEYAGTDQSVSSADLSSSSDVPFYDSDQQSANGDDFHREDTKTLLKTQVALRSAHDRIEELEETLLGKQLALDNVISENTKLKSKLEDTKIPELELIIRKRDEAIQQLSNELQTTRGDSTQTKHMEEARYLTEQVQQLQSQIQSAGKLLEAQASKHNISNQALQHAKTEILNLQDIILEKDQLLNQLSEKVNLISKEYKSMKLEFEASKQSESKLSKELQARLDNSDEIQRLTLALAESQRREGEMKETIGAHNAHTQEMLHNLSKEKDLQITQMKDELHQQFCLDIDELNSQILHKVEEYTELLQRFNESEDTKRQLSSQLEQMTNVSEEATEISKPDQSLREKTADYNELQAKLSETEKENERLVQELNLKEQTVLELEEFKDNHLQILEKLKEYEKKVKDLESVGGAQFDQEDKHSLDDEMQQLKRENIGMSQMLKDYKSKMETLEERLSAVTSEPASKVAQDSDIPMEEVSLLSTSQAVKEPHQDVLHEKTLKIQQLEHKLSQLQANPNPKIVSLQIENDRLSDCVKNYEEKIKDLEHSVKINEKENNEIVASESTQNSSAQTELNEKDSSVQEVEMIKESYSKMSILLNEYEQKIQSLEGDTAEIHLIREDNARISELLVVYEEKIEMLERKLQDRSEEAELNLLREDNTKMSELLQVDEEKIHDLEEKLQEMPSEVDIERAKRDYPKLAEILKVYEQKTYSLQLQLQEKCDMEELNFLQEDNYRMSELLKVYEEKIQSLELELQSKQDESVMNQLKDDVSKLMEVIKDRDEKIRCLEERQMQYSKDKEQLSLEMDQLNEECEQMSQQLKLQDTQLKESQTLASQLTSLQQEYHFYRNQNDELKNKINIQQDSVISQKSQLEVLFEEHSLLKEQLVVSQQEVESLTLDLNKAAEDKSLYLNQVKTLENELTECKVEMEKYCDMVKHSETEIQNSKSEIEMYKSRNFNLEEDMLSLRLELERSQKGAKEIVETLRLNLQESEREKQEAEEKLIDGQLINQQYSDQLMEKETLILSLKSDLQDSQKKQSPQVLEPNSETVDEVDVDWSFSRVEADMTDWTPQDEEITEEKMEAVVEQFVCERVSELDGQQDYSVEGKEESKSQSLMNSEKPGMESSDLLEEKLEKTIYLSNDDSFGFEQLQNIKHQILKMEEENKIVEGELQARNAANISSDFVVLRDSVDSLERERESLIGKLQHTMDERDKLLAVISTLTVHQQSVDQTDGPSVQSEEVKLSSDTPSERTEEQSHQERIEDLRSQYEAKLDALKQELAAEKQTKEPTEMEKSLLTRYQQETEALRSKLDEEARTHLDRILENQNKILQGQIEELQTKHEDNINLQMQAMQMTLEQVYDSQVKIVTAHLEQKHQASLQQLQENLTKEHKEEINRLEMEWTSKMNQLQQEHEDELNDSLLEDSLSTQETEASVIQKLYKRLSEEHKELVKKIHDGLENTAPRTPRKKRHHQEQQTESEEGDTETESVVSLPVTTEEFHHLEERDKVLEKAEDVQKTLESQRLEIDHLRARMLEEYEQLLKTRAEVMSAQTHEVEKLQSEIETLQQSYEEQMKDFQSKVQSQAEEVVKRKVSAEHKKELDDLRNYYEAQLARLHDVQQEVMSQQVPSGETTKEDESSDQIQRQRDYLQATATLTIISDVESESPRQSESRQEIGEITQETETKVKDLEQLLRTKECDLDELKNLLSEKETMIKILEGEKQDLEEKFVKDSEESEVRHVKDLSQFQEKLKKIQSELEASQEQECVLEQQYDELQHQHKEEMEGLRLDLEHERKKEISTVQSEFQVQLEIELKRQAADMSYDYEEKIKSLNEEIEKLERPVPQTTSPDAGLTQEEISRATQEQNVQIEEEADSHSRSSETSSTVVDVKTKETQEGADTDDDQDMSSSESESRPKDGDRKKADSPPQDSEELAQLLSEINRAKEEALITLRDDYENKLQLLTDDLEQALLLNDSREKALDEVSSKYESKINEMRTHYEFRIKELEDASEIDIDDIREKVKVEFVKNYEEELSRVHSEYEEKMELLKQELMEGFEAEKEQMEKEKKTALEDAEEKYDNLIESIRNGDAPEVADLVRERYDTELEMAKALMQQEFEETMESEENRFMEQHQQMMDKFTAERQKEAEELKAQHEKDIEECRNMLVQEYELKIQAMEEKYTEQIDRLSQGMVDPELIKAVEAKVKEVIAAEEVDPQVKTEDAESQEKESEAEEELDQLDRERKDSTQDLNQSLQDVRGSHAAEIARIEAEYEDKLIRLKEGEIARIEQEYEEKLVKLRQELSSTMSTHSQELEAVALDNVAEKVDLDVAHSQELQDMEDRLSQKYDNDINNLEMQYENRIKDMEEKYQNEVDSLKHIIESLQKSSSSEESFQQVPRLSHLDSVDNQNTQEIHRPQSSTPRGDMDGEGQIDRVEIREEGSPPQQVSPRETVLDDYLQSVVDDEEEQSMNLMTFESSVDDSKVLQPPSEKPPEIPRDAGIDIVSEDLVVPEQAKSREHLPELSRRRDDREDDDFEDDENDETVSDGRSTPQDLLQTQAMAETIRALEPLSSYESTAEFSTGEQTGSLGVELKDKEKRIKELESEIDDLQTKFDDIIQRRERENEESRNLERMLRSDLERLSSDRENMQSANEHLLQLLSDSVKTYMNVEESINKKLAKLVSGESADRSQEAGPPHRSPPSPRSPSGAEGGDLPHETSILSNLTDEGLDLSQRTITESIFQGPEMDNEGEELLIDASNRLQSSVAKLLDMIEDTTHQLYDTKRTQQDLVTSVSSGQHETEQISTKYQEVEERLREEVEAKEYLAMELHKAEGLIEGYSTEREQLDQQIQELEEKKEALVLELETTKNKLQDLEQAHHEASSLRSEMQRQQALMQGNVGEEAQVSMETAEVVLPSQEALMLEVNTLNEDKRSLEQQIRTVHEQYDDRLHELQNAGEETERHYVELLTEKKAEVQDLRLKVESLEKQIKSNRQFIEEQAVEREQEREEYQREVDSWKKKVSDKEKQENAENRLQREVENLTEELEDRIHSHSEIVRQTQELKRDLSVEQMTANELKSIVHQLEQELDEKINSEKDLKKKISKLEYELERSEIVEDYDDQEALPADGDEVISESEDSTTGARTTRRRRMLPSHISLQQEEALIQEKEQLQSQLEEQLKQISALRNQLDEMRHRSDYSDESQALSLQRQLDRQKEVVEEKEKQVAELKEEIDDLTSAHINKDKYIENLTNQLQAAASAQGDTGKPNEELLEQLKDENQQLMVRLRSAQGELDSTPLPVLTQSLMEEKNQELDHLNLQLQELQTEIGKLRSGEVLSSLQSEVDRLQNELDKRDTDNIRESQTYSVDGSLTDTEGPPAVSDSFAEKTNLQQELQDSMAQKLEEITELQEEVEQLKSSLQDRDSEIEALKKDLETKKESSQEKSSSTSSREDNVYLNEMLQEKEALLLQTNVQIEALTSEVESLTDFQMKLQEDFDTVQVMLEEKEKEIDTLTKELTEKAPDLDTSETMVKLEQEILKLKKDLKEKDNVIEEKAEEMYLLNEKIEQQASVCSELDDVKITLVNKEAELLDLKEGGPSSAELKVQLEERTDQLERKSEELEKMRLEFDTVKEHLSIAENLQKKLEQAGLLGPDILLREKEMELIQVREELAALKAKLQSEEKEEELQQQKEEIQRLKEELTRKEENDAEEIEERDRQIKKLQDELTELQNKDDELQVLKAELQRMVENQEQQEEARIAELAKPRASEMVSLELAPESEQLMLQFSAHDTQRVPVREEMISMSVGSVAQAPPLQRTEEDIQHQAREDEIVKLQQELDLTKQETDELGVTLREKDESVQKLQTELSQLKQDHNSDVMKLTEQSDHIKALKEELSNVQSLLDSSDKDDLINELEVKVELRDQQHKNNEETISQLRDEVDWLEQQVASLRQLRMDDKSGDGVLEKDKEIVTLQNEITALETKVKAVEELKTQNDEKDSVIEKLQKECENLRSESEKSTVSQYQQGGNNDTFEAVGKMQEKLEKTTHELSDTFAKLHEMENKLGEVNHQMSDKENDYKNLEAEYWQATAQVSESSSKLDEMNEKLSQMSTVMTEKDEKIEHLESSLKEALHSSSTGTEERGELKLKQEALLKEKDQELTDVKQRLKEAVELSEKQLHMVEQKDEEFVKLKLEIQQMIAEKDKIIRETKKQLQAVTREKEEEVLRMKMELEYELSEKYKIIGQLEDQVRDMQNVSAGAGDAVSMIAKLQAQLRERDEAIKEIHKDLSESKQEVEIKAQELTKIKAKLGEQTTPQEGISGEAQKQLDQLKHELQVAKTALSDMQKPGGWRDSRESSVERAAFLQMSSSVEDLDEDLELKEPEELRRDVRLLQKELERKNSELSLFHSTASMSAKDFVKKVMELREELGHEHQRHVQELTERARQEADTNMAQLRFKYEDEIEHMKLLHNKEMDQKMGEVKREMDKTHKTDINKLLARHQQELELIRIRSHTQGSQDVSALDIAQQLQSEVAMAEHLDNRLMRSLTQQPDGQDVADTSSVAGSETDMDENVSARLQMLLNRLHNEGVQMLTMSELQFLNRHMGQSNIDKEVDIASLQAAWENEKQTLLSAVQSLKDLLAQTHKLRGIDKTSDASDWRGELLRTIGYVFAKERENLLAELRSHVLSQPNVNLTEIQSLEQKIKNQEAHQKASLEQIFRADRQSLLAEIRDLRAHSNIASMRHQEEKERLAGQLNTVEEENSKRERQLKRQIQLLEYKLQQEKIIQDDLKTSLEVERDRTSELSNQLSREKNNNLDLHTDVSNLQIQVSKLKDALEREQSRFVSVTSALEEEKGKCHQMSELLERERSNSRHLRAELDNMKLKAEEKDHVDRLIEQLEVELSAERNRRMQSENEEELDRVTISNLQQELEIERKNQRSTESEFKARVKQLTTAVDLEKAKSSDLQGALDRERALNDKLRQSLDSERRSLLESTDRENSIFEDMQMEIDTEKAKSNDLRNTLEREKQRLASQMSSLDSEKNNLKEEVEQERQKIRQMKNEIDQLQIQKLDITRHYEHERDQVSRLKAEREQLRSEIKSLKDTRNEEERQRDTEKVTERRSQRQIERERDDNKMKLHENELEIQRLTQKILDLEDQVSASREKEFDAVRSLEEEKLRNLQNQQSYHANGNQESPRSDDSDYNSRWNVYKTQLESICQSLQFLLLQYQDQLSRNTEESVNTRGLEKSLKNLLLELKQTQMPLVFESRSEPNLLGRPDANTVNERVLHHNAELTNFVSRLTEEKMELRNTLGRLEEEIWRYRQRDNTAQNGDLETSHASADNKHLEDRANWAKERLSLQLALNQAESENDQLKADLRIERERRSSTPLSNGHSSESDRERIQRLYGKYLRADSYRKALIYQKKYLLLLLGGFQDCEETTLALIARMGVYPSPEDIRGQHRRPFTMFRSAARVVIAVSRMKYLVRKWRRATRVGSPVMGGTVNLNQGYTPSSGSFSPPRLAASPRMNGSALGIRNSPLPSFYASALPSYEPQPRQSSTFSPSVGGNGATYFPSGGTSSSPLTPASGFNGATNFSIHTTPPTKDYSSRHYSSPKESSGARRKILSSSSNTPKSATPSRRVRIAEEPSSLHDDYINRLENLQLRLGNMESESPKSRTYPRR